MSDLQKRVELLPCPFCGSTNINDTIVSDAYNEDNPYSRAVCPDCAASAGEGERQREAWNTRAVTEREEKLMDELKELLYAWENANDLATIRALSPYRKSILATLKSLGIEGEG